MNSNQNVRLRTVKVPDVGPRQVRLARVDLERLLQQVRIQAHNDLVYFDDLLECLMDGTSITDMACVAVCFAMSEEFGEAYDLPREQYAVAVCEYINHLSGEKHILAARAVLR